MKKAIRIIIILLILAFLISHITIVNIKGSTLVLYKDPQKTIDKYAYQGFLIEFSDAGEEKDNIIEIKYLGQRKYLGKEGFGNYYKCKYKDANNTIRYCYIFDDTANLTEPCHIIEWR